MSKLQVIEHREVLGKDFQMYGTFEEPLFLAKDVAEWIEYDVSSINKMLNNIDTDEKVRKNVPTLGGVQEAWFLTEDGLYEVLMQSRKPIAKRFKKEVKKLLKDLRTGKSQIIPTSFSEALRLAAALEEEKEKLLLENNQKDQIIGELKPKADYTDLILKSTSLVNITQIAKDYGMSGTKMNELLHEYGVQYKQGNQWLLYAKYHDKGYTQSQTIDIVRSDGRADTKMNTKWTQKGRLFIYNLLKPDGFVPTIEKGLSA